MKSEDEFAAERACDVADARLGIVEDLRWVVAFLVSACVYLHWNSLLIAFLSYWFPIFLLPYSFIKESDAAHDRLNRLTGTGKYSIAMRPLGPSE